MQSTHRKRSRRPPAAIAPLHPAALWETIAGSLGDAVLLVDPDGRIALLNPAAEQLIGRAQKHILGQPCADIFRHTPALAEMVTRTAATGQAQARTDEIHPRRGRAVPVRLHTAAIWTPDGATIRGTAVTIHDLSYRRALEEDARRSEQLAHLATLVAGLAHEIKNPLGGVKGAAQLLATKLRQHAEATQYTDVIVRETNRLTKLVDELLQLGAPRPPAAVPLNIHRVIQDVLGLLAPELESAGIARREEFDPSLPDVNGDPAQLTQVLLNVIKNAVEAMRGAPAPPHVLTITTRIETDFHLVRQQEGSGKLVRIEVADTGPGLAPEARARLFEPFYSTKARGTGIGLAICQRIMAAHHGSIRIDNGPHRGAVVTLSLPLAQ